MDDALDVESIADHVARAHDVHYPIGQPIARQPHRRVGAGAVISRESRRLDGCKERIDAIEVRQTTVPMLVLRITETCKGTPFTLKPGEVSEVIVMCGVGPTGKPSCAERSLGRVARSIARSKHSRMEFACDGSLVTTEWDGNYGDMLLSHRKDALQFP